MPQKEGPMSLKEKTRKFLPENLKNKRRVLAVYLILRLLVILVMIAQVMNGNYENVYICLLTLVLFLVPSFLERKLRIELPDTLEIIILIFIYSAEILGEIREYYLLFPFWDTLLHTLNGFLFAAIGFSLVHILNENKRVALDLKPGYQAIMAFCFSMTIGVLWEFFEWGMDSWFGLDMQKDTVMNAFQSVMLDPGGHNIPYQVKDVVETVIVFADGTFQPLGLGGYLDLGLQDTMMDLLVNFAGAVVFSTIRYFYVKSKGKGKVARHFIPRAVEEQKKE